LGVWAVRERAGRSSTPPGETGGSRSRWEVGGVVCGPPEGGPFPFAWTFGVRERKAGPSTSLRMTDFGGVGENKADPLRG